jgi:hypothetical protein
MESTKAEELIAYGEKLGIPKELTLLLRNVYKENRSLSETIRHIQNGGMDNHHVRILLVSAFDLPIGSIQILHLWWEGFITDADLDIDLREKIAQLKEKTLGDAMKLK